MAASCCRAGVLSFDSRSLDQFAGVCDTGQILRLGLAASLCGSTALFGDLSRAMVSGRVATGDSKHSVGHLQLSDVGTAGPQRCNSASRPNARATALRTQRAFRADAMEFMDATVAGGAGSGIAAHV